MKKAYFILITIFTLTGFVKANSYSEEMEQAHKYAFEHWITTIENIDKAGMYSDLNRISMAKMISNFAINILWLKPDYSLNCTFDDVSANKDAQYDYWVTKACQLWLMWIWNNGEISENFNPNGTVTRWQRATAFSRAISKANWETVKEWDPYYRNHMKYLNSKWIINDINNPAYNAKELRWNVMLMMQRTNWLLSNSQWNNTEEHNNQENVYKKDISQSCITYEDCLEYLTKIWEEQHEMTCINSEALWWEDRTYIIEWHIASLSPMFNMLSDNTNVYLWWWTYWDSLWILEDYTENDVVEDKLSALSKVLKLWTPLVCTPWVIDKSVFQIPNNIEFLSKEKYMEKISTDDIE